MKILQQAKSNSFVSNSFYIFISRFFPSLAGLLVLLYYSRNLDVHTYGSYQNFWIQLNVLYPIACFGVQVVAITYPADALKTIAKRIAKWQYAAYTTWVFVLSLAFAFLQYHFLNISFIIPFLFILFFIVSAIIESLLVVGKSFTFLAWANLIYSTLFLLAHFLVLHSGFAFELLFKYLLLLSALKLLACLLFMRGKLSSPGTPTNIDISKVRSLWLHLGVYDIIQVVSNWIDKFIISLLMTASVSAVYFNGAMNIPFLGQLLSAAASAILVQMASKNNEDETKRLISLVNQSAKLLSCIVLPLFFFLLFFRKELFTVLLTEKYLDSVTIFLISILVLPLRAYGFTTVLQNRHKGSIINKGALMEILLSCAMMYPLYQWIGLLGVALSFVISTYVQAIFYIRQTSLILKVDIQQLLPVTNTIKKLIVFSIAFIGIHYIGLRFFNAANTLILGSVSLGIVILLSLFIELKRTATDDTGS